MRRIVGAICVAIVVAAIAPLAAAGPAAASIAGHWRLNEALTNQVQPKLETEKTGGGGSHVIVTAGGMPIPSGGAAGYPDVGGASPDPKVMRCGELTLMPAGDVMQIDYQNVGTERLKRGNDQGLVSKWKDDKLTTSYKTTTRTVSQEWEVGEDNRLLVTIKLDAKDAKALTYKRVLDRVTP